MEEQESIISIVKNIAQTFLLTITDLANLAGNEALLAGKSFFKIIQLTAVIKILSIITWLNICGAIAFYVVSIGLSWALALLIIAAINFIALLCASLMALKAKKNLTFPATRRQLRFHTDKDISHGQFKKESQMSGTKSNS